MAMNEEEEDQIIRKFIGTNGKIISYINAQAKKGQCIKREEIAKEFKLEDEELDLHLKLIHEIDQFLIQIDKAEYCSYAGIKEALERIREI